MSVKQRQLLLNNSKNILRAKAQTTVKKIVEKVPFFEEFTYTIINRQSVYICRTGERSFSFLHLVPTFFYSRK